MRSKPLSGIRVLDLTRALAGPFALHGVARYGSFAAACEAVRFKGRSARSPASRLFAAVAQW